MQGPLHGVADRHDAYVRADSTLTETQKARDLRDTRLLLQLVDEAVEGAEK